ncbi:MAG: VanZ family protein [Xanthomonadales bacterium]|nr:VanZ family protein [Xanthomonadales bacterium]
MSALRRLWWLIGAGWLVLIVALSLLPLPELPGPDVPFQDKWGHLLAYGFAAVWFAQLGTGTRAMLVTGVGLVLFGFALEQIQALLPYRQAEPLDLAADALGTVLGLGLAATPAGRWLRTLERRTARRPG